MNDEADSSWRELSNGESDEMLARRHRSDKISKLMGEYLLKGHRMLATTCQVCMTILMEDKTGKQYCVACDEVDKKPAVSNTSQNQQLRPMEIKEGAIFSSSPRNERPNELSQNLCPVDDDGNLVATLQETKSILTFKLRSASKRLADEENLTACIEYASLIKVYADALVSVGDAAKRNA